MAKKIRINSTTGQSDGTDLDGYYFEEAASGGGYNFYASNGTGPLNTEGLITRAVPNFSCTIPAGLPGAGLKFQMSVTSFPAVEAMTGTWSDLVQGIRDVPGSGTFQAQASGTGPMEEEAAAASAK